MTPTLNALYEFDAAHSQSARLSDMGLILLSPPEQPWPGETPLNSFVFAHTGGDSVHFCLLDVSGSGITEQSPVIMVVPCGYDRTRFVVGDSVRDFLALGCTIGFFFLEQLAYNFEETLTYIFDYDTFVKHCYFGQLPPADDLSRLAAQRQLLHELSAAFRLEPWPDPKTKFEQLQQRWTQHIQLPS